MKCPKCGEKKHLLHYFVWVKARKALVGYWCICSHTFKRTIYNRSKRSWV